MFKVNTTSRNIRRSVSPAAAPAVPATPSAEAIATPKVPDTPMHAMNTSFTNLMDAESAAAFLKPWLRLERGLRLQRFRMFADTYPGLTAEEKEALCKVLIKANDARMLNTKQQIQYEDGKIQSIRGLRMTRVGDGPAVFKIDVTRPTKKKKDSGASVIAAGSGSEADKNE